jgi:magnesium-transporting ATPase (P-type)
MSATSIVPAAGEVDPEKRVLTLVRDLRTTRAGLTQREAERRLAQYGRNEIERRGGPGHLHDLARQFTHPLASLLWLAAVLAYAAGTATLSVAIVAVIVLNAVFAFVQELQAERATEVLATMLPARARVRRSGAAVEIEAADLVPGDIVLLSEGERLCADARLLDGSLEVDMAALTGESQPVLRTAARVHRVATPLEADDLSDVDPMG